MHTPSVAAVAATNARVGARGSVCRAAEGRALETRPQRPASLIICLLRTDRSLTQVQNQASVPPSEAERKAYRWWCMGTLEHLRD